MKRVNRSLSGMRAAWGDPDPRFMDECMRLVDNGLTAEKVSILWCIVQEFNNRKALWAESYAVIEGCTEGADYIQPTRSDGSSLSFDDKIMLGIISDSEVDRFESYSW